MICLGQFVPSCDLREMDGSGMVGEMDAPAIIAAEFRAWLWALGIEPRETQIGVRTPVDTRLACESTPVLLEWHRDGAGPNPTDPDVIPSVKTLICWSNKTPTRVRTLKRGVFVERIFVPFDVILFDNVKVWHRSPPPEDGRWFVGIADPKVSE